METEILATSAVKKRIAQTKYLSPFINEGDKEPSWDGFIYAYTDSSKKKAQMIGRVAVQIKGMNNKNKRKRVASFSMDRSDLENYRADGGIILFAVYIGTNYEETIYYSSLTPFVLNCILAQKSHSTKLKVVLKPLPDEADELCNIVINFIRDSKKQGLIRNGHIWTLEEIERLFGADNMEFNFSYTGIGYKRNDPFSYLCKNDFYMYVQNREKTITIPLHHIEHIDRQVLERTAKIKIGEREFIENTTFSQYPNGKIEYSIGKCLTFIYDKGSTIFKYNLHGNLDERISAIEILLGMIENKKICVNEVLMDFSPSAEELEEFDVESKKNQLEYYRLIKETLNKLNIQKSLDMDNLSEKAENNLKMLLNAILYHKTANFKENGNIPVTGAIEIANLKILLTFRPEKDGSYRVEDFFNSSLVCFIDGKEEYPTTPFCLLQKDDYLQIDNLVLEKFVEKLEQFDNDGHIDKVVSCVLEMIKAFDSDVSRKELLDSAKNLCTWLSTKRTGNIIHRINYLQCCVRERELTKEEIKELSDIIANEEMDASIHAGVSILLGSKNMAQRYLDMLNGEQIKEFESYPIYRLLERM